MPNFIDMNLLSQLIQGATQQQVAKNQFIQGFNLTQPTPPTDFSLAQKGQAGFKATTGAGKAKTNYQEMLKGMTLALASSLALLKGGQNFIGGQDVGFKYPVQIKNPYTPRPLGFKSILGGK